MAMSVQLRTNDTEGLFSPRGVQPFVGGVTPASPFPAGREWHDKDITKPNHSLEELNWKIMKLHFGCELYAGEDDRGRIGYACEGMLNAHAIELKPCRNPSVKEMRV